MATHRKDTNANGWDEWKNSVLGQLGRQEDKLGQLQSTISEIQVELGKIAIRTSVLALVAGSIPTALSIIWAVYSKGL